MLSIGPSTTINAILGSQGPAPGIRAPVSTQTTPADGPNLEPLDDGSITYRTARRTNSSFVTNQSTVEPITPLKTRAEGMRGRHLDVQV